MTSENDTGDSLNKRGLSYKYQRLREALRAAVMSGEFTEKLPGERELARRFHVNAKTLSKALTDLAAEGLLDRSIGRGTYVKGNQPPAKNSRWLMICDAGKNEWALPALLRKHSPELEVITPEHEIRPSLLKKFDAVIDAATHTPEAFLRDLIVRGMRVVTINREPDVLALDSVSVDTAYAGACLARDLLLAGHQRLIVVESRPRSPVARVVGQVAARYAPEAQVHACGTDDALAAAGNHATAVIVDSIDTARVLRREFAALGVSLPHQVSLAAIGACDSDEPASGYYADCEQLAGQVAELLSQPAPKRPVNIWLAARYVDRGTIGPV
jgi:hypothetical protein